MGMGKKRTEKGILITLGQPMKLNDERPNHNINPIEFT